MPISTGIHLGDYSLTPIKFKDIETFFGEFAKKSFKELNSFQKSEKVNRALLELIQKADPNFLLIAALDYIQKINEVEILENYTFLHFEMWLNQFSKVTAEENEAIRGSLVGKTIPRSEYQLLFPIGMGKTYSGSHYVTAHSSPDLDTTVASFWGWIDAFGARVAEGLHIWNLPGGPPSSQVEIGILFNQIFGQNVFTSLIKDRSSLSLSSLDLLSQKGVERKSKEISALSIDHESHQHAVILVDDEGFYLGDFRHFDAEGVRFVVLLLNQCLRWYENHLHLNLISLFAKEKLSLNDLSPFFSSVFEICIKDAAPVKEFDSKQVKYLEAYLKKVLHVQKGLDATFEEFAIAMKELKIFDFEAFVQVTLSLKESKLFNQKGELIEDRPQIFDHLKKIIAAFSLAVKGVRNFVDRLEIALRIKENVLGDFPNSLSPLADLEELKNKMGNYPYLTITLEDASGKLIPLGVVHASDIHKQILGTVSVRDFCNREETKIPSYFEVISVIDHHKTSLNTFSAPIAFIADAQSSNALVAEIAFRINDRYSTLGVSLKEINAQIQELQKDLSAPSSKRVMQRLLQKQMILEKGTSFFISPQREFVEYLHFLYAILDDTDLLTKVSTRDVECVASLINRLKSLLMRKEVEVITLEDIDQNKDFVRLAAARILQHPDMFSLYSKIYYAKEEAVEENIKLSAKRESSSFFADTKEQNGCCRVGQFKMFARNFPLFYAHASTIRKIWAEEAFLFNREKPEVDLHIQMISTIASADDVYSGAGAQYEHKDEMWMWIPKTEQAIEHLRTFLNAFSLAKELKGSNIEVEFLGSNAKELERVFKESFKLAIRTSEVANASENLPLAVLRFNAGIINSRKAVVSPCLPRLVN